MIFICKLCFPDYKGQLGFERNFGSEILSIEKQYITGTVKDRKNNIVFPVFPDYESQLGDKKIVIVGTSVHNKYIWQKR